MATGRNPGAGWACLIWLRLPAAIASNGAGHADKLDPDETEIDVDQPPLIWFEGGIPLASGVAGYRRVGRSDGRVSPPRGPVPTPGGRESPDKGRSPNPRSRESSPTLVLEPYSVPWIV